MEKSILNLEPLDNNEEHNLTSANVTAKTARKLFVLKIIIPLNVERKLVEQNISTKAVYELPFKVTVENTGLDVFNIRYSITVYLLTAIFTK